MNNASHEEQQTHQTTYRVSLGAIWGVLGVLAILGQAIWKLSILAWEPFQDGLPAPWVLGLYAASMLLNGYAEGYRGFQKAFAPRVVVRAFWLSEHGRWYQILLAPAFCMSLFHATRRQLIVSWTILIGVVILVVLIARLDQPWRGIIDAGVVVGLGWGAAAILIYLIRALCGKPVSIPAEVPPS